MKPLASIRKLSAMGAGMKYLDVGGGLGMDYDGSQTEFRVDR